MSRLSYPFVLLLSSPMLAQFQSDLNSKSVRGTVLGDDERPVNNAVVEVRNVRNGNLIGKAFTSPSGDFQVPGVAAGRYIISVMQGSRSMQQEILVGNFEPDLKLSMPGVQASDPKARGATVSVASLGVPDKARRAYDSARKALSSNKLTEAMKDVNSALQIAPQFADALSLRAVLYLASGNPQMAVQIATESVKIDPNNCLGYTILGASYNVAGQFLKAVAPLEEALRVDPGFWQSHFEIGKMPLWTRQISFCPAAYRGRRTFRPQRVRAGSYGARSNPDAIASEFRGGRRIPEFSAPGSWVLTRKRWRRRWPLSHARRIPARAENASELVCSRRCQSHTVQGLLQRRHHLFECSESERLRSVGQGALRTGMYFHHQTVSTQRHCSTRHRWDKTGPSRAMGRIRNDGQMRKLLGQRDGSEVQRITRLGLEGANAALA